MNEFAKENPDRLGNFAKIGNTNDYVRDGKILVGFKHDPHSKVFCYDLTKPRYLPMPLNTPNPPRGMFIGKAGDGKTSLIGLAIWHAIMRKQPCFVLDPKASMAKFKEPQKNPRNIEILRKLNLTPQGLDIHVMCPEFLRGEQGSDFVDSYFRVSKADLDSIKDSTVRAEIIKDLIDSPQSGDDPSYTHIMGIWKQCRTFRELIDNLRSATSTRGRERLINLAGEGMIDLDSVTCLNIVEKMKEKPVVMQLSTSGLGKEVQALVQYGIQVVKEAAERGEFNFKTVLVIGEEIDTLLQGSAGGTKQLQFTYTKYREKPKFSPLFVLQNPGEANNRVYLQSEYMITSKQKRSVGKFRNDGYDLTVQFNQSVAGIVTRLKDRGSLPNKHISEKLLVVADKVMTFIPLITPFNT